MFKKPFVLSDESINSYGTWLKNDGAVMENFSKNAPLYFDHRTYGLPIGHVENVRLENGKWLGDVCIEGGNETELEFIRKIENGDIKGISLGVDVLATSSEAALIKQGQRYETIVKWEPYEASLTATPSNKNALVLRFQQKGITLSQAGEGVNQVLNPIQEMKQIALKLGLAETATEAQIVEAINNLQLSLKTASEAILELADTLEGDAKGLFTELAPTNPKAAIKLAKVTKAQPSDDVQIKLSQLLGGKGGSQEPVEDFDTLQRTSAGQEKLRLMKTAEPDKYKKLVQDYAASKG